MQYSLGWSQKQSGNKLLLANTVIIVFTTVLVQLFACVSSSSNGKSTDLFEVDVVGYGEDCSPDEGPYCDEEKHLTCDEEEEICVCNSAEGYVNIKDVPGGLQQFADVDVDENGNGFYNTKGTLCISQAEIIKRTDELLGLPSEHSYAEDSYEIKDEDLNSIPPYVTQNAPYASDKSMSIFNSIMQSGMLEVPNYDEKRLERFKLRNHRFNLHLSGKELILKELLNYRKDPLLNLDQWQPTLQIKLDKAFKWRDNKISNSICSRVFDIDQDELFTAQEYAISLYSELVRDYVLPKAFLSFIRPLVEHSCISLQDLEALEHDPGRLKQDFDSIDENKDECISYDEFLLYSKITCNVDWMTDFLMEKEIQTFVDFIDPIPEEMFIRWILQTERIISHVDAMDEDKDGFISYEELDEDLMLPDSIVVNARRPETDKLITHLDKNGDGLISLEEIKSQISRPDVTEDFEYDWLESLSELYETDEEEVQEYVKIVLEIKKLNIVSGGSSTTGIEHFSLSNKRIFEIFDKNRNDEIDEVEFKLLTDTVQKYFLIEILNTTIDTMDVDSDRKLSVFEFYNFFNNVSSAMRMYLKNLVALENLLSEEMQLDTGEPEEADLDESRYYNAMDEEDEEEIVDEENKTVKIPTTKLLNVALNSNETKLLQKLFKRLDINSDSFITNEDVYFVASSFKSRRLPSELKAEFDEMDANKDGMLTSDDSEEFQVPLDFKTYEEVSSIYNGEVLPEQRITRFNLLDSNKDGRVSKMEFLVSERVLFDTSDDENMFLDWLEHFLASIPDHFDKGAEKAFSDFDANCDKFISSEELRNKVDHLRDKIRENDLSWKILKDSSTYFISLDLNKDGKISMNEFQMILLGSNIKHKENSLL